MQGVRALSLEQITFKPQRTEGKPGGVGGRWGLCRQHVAAAAAAGSVVAAAAASCVAGCRRRLHAGRLLVRDVDSLGVALKAPRCIVRH